MSVGLLSLGTTHSVGQGSPAPLRATGEKNADRQTANLPNSPFGFAIRTTAAALLALAVAGMLDIHHPWWAAMTVWLVAQPTRGLLIERSVARLVGTICGAVAGAFILTGLGQTLLLALAALALWLAVCAGLGTIFRHFRNYGFVLAGYTAAIVVMFGLGDDHMTAALALDRVLCTLIGLASSTLLSFRALPLQDAIKRESQARNLLDRTLNLAEGMLSMRESLPDKTLISDICAFDRTLDEQAAGSLRRRLDAPRLRHISGLLLELIALARREPGTVTRSTPCLDSDPLQRVQHMAQQAATAGRTAAARTLGELETALQPSSWAAWQNLRFDFDLKVAVLAAVRPVLALTTAAILWQATGWQAGAMMAMTAVLFTSLFSSHDHGNHMVMQVLMGTLAGAVAGLSVRLFLLPEATDLLATLVYITPVLLVAAWLMRQPATAKMAIDVAMTFLLTAQPGSAPTAAAVALSQAAAIIAGVLIAVAIFWLLVPSTPMVKCRLLALRIARLTARIARSSGYKTSTSAHQALRNAQVSMLQFTKAESPLVHAVQACLATAANVQAIGQDVVSASVNASGSTLKTAQEEALRASTALENLISSNSRMTS